MVARHCITLRPGATRSARKLSVQLDARVPSLCGCGCCGRWRVSPLQEWSRRGPRSSFLLSPPLPLRVPSRICSMLLHFPPTVCVTSFISSRRYVLPMVVSSSYECEQWSPLCDSSQWWIDIFLVLLLSFLVLLLHRLIPPLFIKKNVVALVCFLYWSM